MNRRTIAILASTFVALLVFCGTASSQAPDAPDIPDLPPGVSLPEVSPSSGAAKLVNASNAASYRGVIIPELYGLVRSDAFQMEAARRIQYAWRYDDEFERNSQTPYAGGLTENGWLQPGDLNRRWFVFGDASEIDRESNPGLQGQKILWNTNSVWWSQKILDFDFDLFKAGQERPESRLAGNLLRVYPHMLDSSDKTDQLFREKISFTLPAFLKNLSWLTFRFLAQDEDVLWVYSPAISRTRELTGANRADAIVRTSLSPDDLLVWSGKSSLTQARLDRTMVALVPFPRLDLAEAGPPIDECETLRPEGAAGKERWNFESRRFVNGAPWLPVGSIFVPRRLYRLELVSRDAFSQYGRQVIYVDASMMLPVYKVVFDRAGRLWKIVIAATGLAASHDRKRRVPYLSYLLAVDFLKNQNSIMEFSKVTYCQNYNQTIKLAAFDPRKLGPEATVDQQAPAAASVATSAPAVEVPGELND